MPPGVLKDKVESAKKDISEVFTVCTQCKRILMPIRKNSAPPALRVSSGGDDDEWINFEDISNTQAVTIVNLSHGLCSSCYKRMDALVDSLPPSYSSTVVRKLPPRSTSSPQFNLKHPSPPGPMRVLVVDDNKLQRTIHKRMVEQAGYQCDVASSAMQAIEMVQKHSYTLVLMDLMMEGMDGWSGAKAIRRVLLQAVGFAGLPKIVAATGLPVDRKLVEDCAEAGMDDIIHKPVAPAALTRLLNRYAGQVPSA